MGLERGMKARKQINNKSLENCLEKEIDQRFTTFFGKNYIYRNLSSLTCKKSLEL
jgi:hypothetical protein